MTTEIPTIHLDDPDERDIAIKLREACQNVGFFYLGGHGISQDIFDEVLIASKELFALPLDEKKVLSDPVMNRGYTAFGEETLDPSVQTCGDTKEGYYIGRDVPRSSPKYNPSKLSGPNIWPTDKNCSLENHEKFKDIMSDYFDRASSVGFKLVRLLALSLGLEKNHFDEAFDEPLAALRLLHYSSQKSQPKDGIFACGAHSDYGMATLLLTDDNPGLEILTLDDRWIPVPPRKGFFIVNLGDMLERWTNGSFRSTVHRVITSGETERFSVPFFYEPNFDTTVSCLDICCNEENPPRYPTTTSGQHLLDKYAQTHADFTPTAEISS